jgi:two-component system, NarL family, sensor histidine kinase DevS
MGEPIHASGTGDRPIFAGARMDELLTGFVDQAGELVNAQQRMRGLLDAVVALAEDLSLEAVLQRVVNSACTLLGAGFGALGVISEEHDALSHFITVGIDDETARRIGPLPTGHGVLGLLIRDPKPLRLHDLSRHPEAYGFPKNHPPMKSFLGVPIRVRDSVFGNLYLTEKEGGGDFTDEDEDLAQALAAAAGVAIENARLYDDSRRRTGWLEASMEVTRKMMDEDTQEGEEGALEMIAGRALRESGSELALLLVQEQASDLFHVAGAAGERSSDWAGRILALNYPEIRAVVDTGKAKVLDDAATILGQDAAAMPGRLLAMDLSTHGTHHGLLVLVRKRTEGTFRPADIEMGTVFCSHVAMGLELARARLMREQLAVFTDRDRIARDLHDLVIQRLFATGLSIQSLQRFSSRESQARTIAKVTAELDETIRELRNTIYSLSRSSGEVELLSSRILQTVRSATQSLPFVPHLTLTGPIDSIRDESTVSNVLAVLTEGLSNAVRHSGAESISVSIALSEGWLAVHIKDDGGGFSTPGAGNGLSNMLHRAGALGGKFEVHSSPGSGAEVEWTAPVF